MKDFIKKHPIELSVLIAIVVYFLASPSAQLKAIDSALSHGSQMINKGIVGRDCTRVDFNYYPELKARLNEAVRQKIVSNYGDAIPSQHRKNSCIKDMKIVQLSFPDKHNATVVYRCEANGIGEELKVTSFQDSCSYTAYLAKWDFPIGTYTTVSEP